MQNTPKHTHGPWHYNFQHGVILAKDNQPLGFEWRNKVEANANLALLAAAPELLTMLKDVQTWLETNLELGNINAGTANRDGDLVSQIRAAIAKANGGDK